MAVVEAEEVLGRASLTYSNRLAVVEAGVSSWPAQTMVLTCEALSSGQKDAYRAEEMAAYWVACQMAMDNQVAFGHQTWTFLVAVASCAMVVVASYPWQARVAHRQTADEDVQLEAMGSVQPETVRLLSHVVLLSSPS
jgi:hypothetical protein